MRAALVRGDAEGARRALQDYRSAADAAADSTSGPTWWTMKRLPLLGDDARGVATVADVLADLGRDALPPVVDAAEDVTADTFQPVRHRFPLRRVAALAPLAEQSERAFADASARLAAVDPSGFLGAVHTGFDDLRAVVDDGRSTLQSTYRAARLMPMLLGQEKPRNFLLVMQNNAESRSSGGLPGSLSLVRASNGKVEIVEQSDMAELGASRAPVLRLTREERELFGPSLGTMGINATLTPDIPRAADLIRARWERVRGGRVDGVIFVDPVAVSYLLGATGQIAVPPFGPVSASDVVAKVENEVYARVDGAAAQSAYQNAVARAVFDTLSDGYGNSADVVRALVLGVEEGRVRMHFFGEGEQAEIEGTRIAGEFVDQAGAVPQVGVYVNDAGPSKMQFYLDREASLTSRSCVGDRQTLAGSITLTNDTPPDPDQLADAITGEFVPDNRTEPGKQLLVVYLTAPAGGELVELATNGQRLAHPVVLSYAGHEVAPIEVDLEPGETETVDFVVRTGPGQTGDPYLAMSPGARSGSPNGSVSSSCRVR